MVERVGGRRIVEPGTVLFTAYPEPTIPPIYNPEPEPPPPDTTPPPGPGPGPTPEPPPPDTPEPPPAPAVGVTWQTAIQITGHATVPLPARPGVVWFRYTHPLTYYGSFLRATTAASAELDAQTTITEYNSKVDAVHGWAPNAATYSRFVGNGNFGVGDKVPEAGTDHAVAPIWGDAGEVFFLAVSRSPQLLPNEPDYVFTQSEENNEGLTLTVFPPNGWVPVVQPGETWLAAVTFPSFYAEMAVPDGTGIFWFSYWDEKGRDDGSPWWVTTRPSTNAAAQTALSVFDNEGNLLAQQGPGKAVGPDEVDLEGVPLGLPAGKTTIPMAGMNGGAYYIAVSVAPQEGTDWDTLACTAPNPTRTGLRLHVRKQAPMPVREYEDAPVLTLPVYDHALEDGLGVEWVRFSLAVRSNVTISTETTTDDKWTRLALYGEDNELLTIDSGSAFNGMALILTSLLPGSYWIGIGRDDVEFYNGLSYELGALALVGAILDIEVEENPEEPPPGGGEPYGLGLKLGMYLGAAGTTPGGGTGITYGLGLRLGEYLGAAGTTGGGGNGGGVPYGLGLRLGEYLGAAGTTGGGGGGEPGLGDALGEYLGGPEEGTGTTPPPIGPPPPPPGTPPANAVELMLPAVQASATGWNGFIWFKFTIEEAGWWEINTDDTPSQYDTYLILFDNEGWSLDLDDDGGDVGYLSRLRRELEPGTYYVAAGWYSLEDTGQFEVDAGDMDSVDPLLLNVIPYTPA